MVWTSDKDKKVYIFIHIPKTGGTTIEHSLNLLTKTSGYGFDMKNKKVMQHYIWTDYQRLFGKVYEMTTRFSICRNTYDKLVSEYYWCRMKNVGFRSGKSMDDFISFNNLFHNSKFSQNSTNFCYFQ